MSEIKAVTIAERETAHLLQARLESLIPPSQLYSRVVRATGGGWVEIDALALNRLIGSLSLAECICPTEPCPVHSADTEADVEADATLIRKAIGPTEHHRLCNSRQGRECDCYMRRYAKALAALDRLKTFAALVAEQK